MKTPGSSGILAGTLTKGRIRTLERLKLDSLLATLFSISANSYTQYTQYNQTKEILPYEKAPENYPRGHSVSPVSPAG